MYTVAAGMDFLAQYRWRPGIGDPTFLGWFTVVAYAVAAILAASAGRGIPPRNDARRGSRQLWLAVAGLMAFLCLNKQLDLQTLFTDIGRYVANHQGWYEQRRGVQKLFVLAVLGTAVAGGGWLAWRGGAFWLGHRLLAAGLVFLLTFIVVRAISLHQFDVFIQSHVLGVRVNGVLELTGIFLVSLAAERAHRADL